MSKLFRFKRSTGCRTERRGTTMVEFAMVIPVFALFCAVLLDFSRLSLARNAVQNAVYRGGRLAMTDGVSREEAAAEVRDYLELFGFAPAEGSIVIGQIYLDDNGRVLPVNTSRELDSDSVEFHVEAAVPMANASFLFPTFLPHWIEGRQIESEIRVRSERYSGFFNPSEAYAD